MASTWIAYAGYYFCRKAFYVAKAKGGIGDALDLSSMELAHIGTGYLIAYSFGQFSAAYAGRWLGPKLLLLVGMGLSLLCNVVFGVSNGFWTVLLFMAINGLAQGTGWPGCIGSLGHWFRREQRGSVLGVWATCYQLGSVAATAYAAYLLGTVGWRGSFFGASLALLVAWTIVLLLHPNTPEHVGLVSVQQDDPPSSRSGETRATQRSKLGWSRDVLTTILTMGAVYFCIKFLRYALWSWTPYFLSQSFGMQKAEAGYLSTVFDICGFVGVLLAGVLSDRWLRGRRSLMSLLMLGGMTLGFVGMYVLGTQSVTHFALMLGLCGLLLYGPDSLLSGVGAIDVGSPRGAMVAAGIINGIGSIGPVFQEQLVGWMVGAFRNDLVPVLAVFVAVALAGTAAMAWLHARARSGRAGI
ncbi:MAG: MFS transporter [Polyangiaceae bacterium]|nr:MFS transporter [Polyangiaceae bacterium]